MPIRAHGRIVFWEGASLWVLGTRPGEGRFPRTAFHSHHAIQVSMALRGEFTLEVRDGLVRGGAAVVAPDAEHAFEAEGVVAHLFVDPDGQLGRAMMSERLSGASVVPLPPERLARLPALLLATFDDPHRTDASLVELGRALLSQVAADGEQDRRPEARVRKMAAWAAARIDKPIALVDAAAQVGLSSGRARHLFVQQTGLPFRTYLLWLRLTKAIELFSAGATLTDAALDAGFSDSSHLSRTFRRMFGIAADSLRLM